MLLSTVGVGPSLPILDCLSLLCLLAGVAGVCVGAQVVGADEEVTGRCAYLEVLGIDWTAVHLEVLGIDWTAVHLEVLGIDWAAVHTEVFLILAGGSLKMEKAQRTFLWSF